MRAVYGIVTKHAHFSVTHSKACNLWMTSHLILKLDKVYNYNVELDAVSLLQSFVGLFDTNYRKKLHVAEGNGIMG